MTAEGLRSWIDRSLFTPVNPYAAAIFRVALGLMVVWLFWFLSPRPSPMPGPGPIPLEFYEAWILTPGYAAVVVLAALAFAAGWKARLAGLCLLVLTFPLLKLGYGGVSRPVVWTILLAYLPLCGGRGPLWPVQLLRLQLSLIYGVNALAKATPGYWNGEVLVGMSRMMGNFKMDLSSGLFPIGPLEVPVAWAAMFSVALEAFLALAFWFRRLRWAAAAVGVGFHLFLQTVVAIFMLDILSMFLYSAFLLDWEGKAPGPRRDRTPIRVFS